MFKYGYTYQINTISPNSGGSPPPSSNWLLRAGTWDDTGEWDDSDVWID